MRVHHLNCGTMRPLCRRLVTGTGGWLETGRMVCHCLLVETGQGLVLVDTGLGLADVRAGAGALGAFFMQVARPVLDPAETAVRQVARLGYRREDVRHIVLTHLDLDHAGGLADFPWATVHVHAAEREASIRRRTGSERRRYRPRQWAHEPTWATYDATGGEPWFGFGAVRELAGLPPEILLVPLVGHTRGHTGVAVDTGGKWLFHAGDAYMFHAETDPVRPRCTPGLRLFQTYVQLDGRSRHANQRRLRELRAAQGTEIEIFSAHDEVELERWARPAS